MHDNRQDRAIVQAPLVAGRALYPGQRTECKKCGRIVWVGYRDSALEAYEPQRGYRPLTLLPDQIIQGRVVYVAGAIVWCSPPYAGVESDAIVWFRKILHAPDAVELISRAN